MNESASPAALEIDAPSAPPEAAHSWLRLTAGATLLAFAAQWSGRWIWAYAGGSGTPDFNYFYMAATLARHRGWRALYSVASQQAELGQLFPAMPFSSYRNPPLLALLVTPLSYLAPWQGFAIWVALMAGCWLISWRILGDVMGWRLLGLGLTFGSLAVLEGLRLGQPIGLMAMCLALAWRWWRIGRPFLAGISSSLLLIKPQLGFLIPVALLAAANWKAVAGWAVGAAVQVLISAILMGTASLDYFVVLANQASGGGGTGRLLAAAPVDWSAIGALGRFAGTVLVIAVVASGCAWVWRVRKSVPEVALGVGAVLSLIATPYGHFEDTALLLPAGLMLFLARPQRWLLIWFALAWLAVFLAVGEGYALLVLMAGVLACLPIAETQGGGP